MKTQEVINRLKQGEVFTLTNLTQSNLELMDWYFEPGEEHECFSLRWHMDEPELLAQSGNDTYEVTRGLESFGGLEGLQEVIQTGGTFEKQHVYENGNYSLK